MKALLSELRLVIDKGGVTDKGGAELLQRLVEAGPSLRRNDLAHGQESEVQDEDTAKVPGDAKNELS